VKNLLKPNGRFAALVFTTPDKSPFFSEPMQILLKHAGRPAPRPGQPGLFALGGEGVLEGLLRSSGFGDVNIARITASVRFSCADDALAFLQEAAGAYRAVIADLRDEAKAAAWDEVKSCLAKFEGDVGFDASIEVLIGAGANST
jgi:hypothetical protein